MWGWQVIEGALARCGAGKIGCGLVGHASSKPTHPEGSRRPPADTHGQACPPPPPPLGPPPIVPHSHCPSSPDSFRKRALHALFFLFLLIAMGWHLHICRKPHMEVDGLPNSTGVLSVRIYACTSSNGAFLKMGHDLICASASC